MTDYTSSEYEMGWSEGMTFAKFMCRKTNIDNIIGYDERRDYIETAAGECYDSGVIVLDFEGNTKQAESDDELDGFWDGVSEGMAYMAGL